MKLKTYISLLSVLLLATFFCQAQTAHPLAFGVTSGGITTANWYANYVGTRFQITAPASIAGTKQYTAANTGASGGWGGYTGSLTGNLKIGPITDTDGCSSYTTGYFTGKIAVIWRGTCEFGFKALEAQNAGAMAVIIVNNTSGAPTTMGAGSYGASVTIPVYMVSMADGTDITNQLNAGVTVSLSLQNWGAGYANDLGFVPEGYSITANYAMPLDQIMSATHPAAYQNKNGAFVANFGTNNATNVKLRSQLNFTPTGGSAASTLYTDSVILSSFPHTDSIWAMFGPQYNIPTVTSTGKFDLNYNISSDSSDAFTGDNSMTYSFYATDSIFSKGRYDFVNNKPICSNYFGTTSSQPFIWTTPYYIAKGGNGYAIKNVQFSVAYTSPGLLPAGDSAVIYIYKWVDNPTGIYHDSLMENSELTLVGQGTKIFDGSTDSAFNTITVPVNTFLDSNSWYVIGAALETNYYLGCDGVLSGYPRAYGRRHFNNYAEYYNPIWFGNRYDSYNGGIETDQVANPNSTLVPYAFEGSGSYDVDSVVFANEEGNIPAIAFSVYTYHNSAPVFTNGAAQHITICGNGSGYLGYNGTHDTAYLDPLLAISDSNSGQTETWMVSVAPVHGNLYGFNASATSTGDTLSPSGLWYYPNYGDTSTTDSFKIAVSDGIATTITTIHVTLMSPPTPGPIIGPAALCIGSSTALTDSVSGGAWQLGYYSGSTPIATITTSGDATGIATGSIDIQYVVSNVCGSNYADVYEAVDSLPVISAITGSGSVCAGTTLTLNDTITGGAWTATNAHAIVTFYTYGSSLISAETSGIDTIVYTVTNLCGSSTAKKSITVLPLPYVSPLAGPSSVCVAAGIMLTDSATGGSWSSSNATATVAAGTVTGHSAGLDTIKYTIANSCGSVSSYKYITVMGLPVAGYVFGGSSVCVGSSVTLADTSSRYGSTSTWSASNSHASVSAGGVVTGVSAGTDTIKYMVSSVCGVDSTTFAVMVNPLPYVSTIFGPATVCMGGSVTLTDSASGGSWSASNATAIVSGGVVAGINPGLDTISYTVSNSCGSITAHAYLSDPGHPSAASITGSASLCAGSSTTLADTISGGVWHATNAHATVSSSGLVAGISAGMDTIKYLVTNACGADSATKIITINPLPYVSGIGGPTVVCTSDSITLTDSVSGGIWSPSNSAATVAGGIVHGVSTGADTISYSLTNTCGTNTTHKILTVETVPVVGTISGATSVCEGSLIFLTDSVAGGSWSSSNIAVASVSGGIVSGITVGSATITYTVTNICSSVTATQAISVITVPSAGTITGRDTLCVGNSITLADGSGSGTWSSSNSATATISATGVLTGVAPGLDLVQYTVTNLCGSANTTFLVNVFSEEECVAILSVNTPVNPAFTLSTYPNPSNGSFTLELPGATGDVSISISDIYGKTIASRTIATTTGIKETFNLENAAAGTYLIKVSNDGKSYRDKIVIWQ